MKGSIEHLAEYISKDLKALLPTQRKTQREAISLLVATMIEVRSANTMELASSLPVEADRLDMRYQRVSRVLSNHHIDKDEVMKPIMKKIFKGVSNSGKTIILGIDQSKVSDDLQLLMLSIRCGDRALPVAWCVKKTKGNIPFSEQKELLKIVHAYVPKGASVVLMGDRFYGTVDLIAACKGLGWDYRLRLKGNLRVFAGSTETTTGKLAESKATSFEKILLTEAREETNIGVVREEGHPEPWIIAMSKKPTHYRTLDYGMRWSIEALFSDFKTRGFGLEDSQLRYPDRLERLILIMTLALLWSAFSGAFDAFKNSLPYEQKQGKKAKRSKLSFFTRGLRCLLRCAQRLTEPPITILKALTRCFEADFALIL